MTHPKSRMTRARRSLAVFGMALLALTAAAVFVTAIVLVASSRPDRNLGESAQAPAAKPPQPPSFPAADYNPSNFPPPTEQPLIGMNYTHYAFSDCTFHRTYIIASYHHPGVANRVHRQLMEMRQDGVTTIRTVLWHDATGQDWGPIPSAGGKLREPFRSNLIHFVTEIKRFNFARFTLAFEPKETHNPLVRKYKPSKFAENWRFIRSVRALVKRYGPSHTRFDLLGEGAPNATPTSYEPLPRQTGRYLKRLYRLYVQRYGSRDVTVSVIASTEPGLPTNRLGNLIRILRSSGEPLPRWYDVHIGHTRAGAARALRQTEAVLDQNGQDQPLVFGDMGYDNRGIAQVLKRFLARTSHKVEEITPWYTRERLGCQVNPPYAPGAYRRVLHTG